MWTTSTLIQLKWKTTTTMATSNLKNKKLNMEDLHYIHILIRMYAHSVHTDTCTAGSRWTVTNSNSSAPKQLYQWLSVASIGHAPDLCAPNPKDPPQPKCTIPWNSNIYRNICHETAATEDFGLLRHVHWSTFMLED